MSRSWFVALSLFLATHQAAHAGEPSLASKSVQVPYRLTDTHHVMVRAKINGKGPFNFIVDTGCPILLVSTPVGKQLGLVPDAKGWTVLDKFDLEGGLVQTKVKCRVETPFQIEGMNSMGLPGVELHGLLGYTVLAKYRMEFDFTRDDMKWSPLTFDPPPPQPLGGKVPTGGLEAMTGLLKMLSFFAGIKPAPPPVPRGFCGFEVAEKDKQIHVQRVLAKSPAADAGLKIGDVVHQVEGKAVNSIAQLYAEASKLIAGKTLRLSIRRDDKEQELTITAGQGL